MLHKKITAVILIVLFQQIGAASVYAQTQPEEQVFDAERVMTNHVEREVQTEVSKAVWEKYAKAALIKHAPKKVAAAAGVVYGPVGIAASFAALFIDVGLGIYELESTPEAKRRRARMRELDRSLKQAKAEREAFQRRLEQQNMEKEDFYDDRDLNVPGVLAQAEADMKRELLRRELQSDPPKPGQPYLRDDQQRTLREINEHDMYVRQVAEERKRRERELKKALALQESLAGQTTGLAPPIGDARFGPWWHTPWHTQPTDVSDTSPPELLPPLPPRLPDWRRRKDVVPPLPPRKPASGQLLGGKGLNIAGILNIFAFDSATQDGDRVQLTVRDSRGTILSRAITLTNAGSSATVLARRGIANVTITALNEGKYPPNTGGLRVRGSVSGVRSGNFNLSRGQSGTLTVRVLGR